MDILPVFYPVISDCFGIHKRPVIKSQAANSVNFSLTRVDIFQLFIKK